MDVTEMVEQVQDASTVKRVFGEPITQDGITVIPVARVSGGGGAGHGKRTGEAPAEQSRGLR